MKRMVERQTGSQVALRAAWLCVLPWLLMAVGVAAEEGADAAETPPSPPPALTESLELTMTLLPRGATGPEAVVRTIQLPAPARAGARADGAETAEQARQRRQDGLDAATEARELGREFGQQRAEEAREDAARGRDLRPDVPSPPGNSGPPGQAGPPGQ